jgi:hypothetical protein
MIQVWPGDGWRIFFGVNLLQFGLKSRWRLWFYLWKTAKMISKDITKTALAGAKVAFIIGLKVLSF